MSLIEIFLIGIALSMDAFAVSITNGIAEPNMGAGKWFAVAFAFAAFQFLMPLLGYFGGAAFSGLVKEIAPWLSFCILALLGGKSVFDYVSGALSREKGLIKPFLREKKGSALTVGKLFVQAIATSLDALAVGVTLLAAETTGGLPAPVVLCTLVIGGTTFALSALAVRLGNRVGDSFSEGAGLLGGLVLIAIGLKILLEGVL